MFLPDRRSNSFFAGYASLQEREEETTTLYDSFSPRTGHVSDAQDFLLERENEVISSKQDTMDFLQKRENETNSLFAKLDTRDFAPVSMDTVELPYMANSAHFGMTVMVGGIGQPDMSAPEDDKGNLGISALNDGSEWQWPA